VERSAGPVATPYTVDWTAEDNRGRIRADHEPHLRLHALTPSDEVALASGQPAPNQPGNLPSLRKVIQSKLGESMETQFVNILEPYDRAPFVSSVRRLPVAHEGDESPVVAVAVTLQDGTEDILISCQEPTAVTVDGRVQFSGRFALLRLKGGKPTLVRLSEASLFSYGDLRINPERARYSGTVVAVDATDPEDNRIRLDPPLPADAPLAGETIHFSNELPPDTSYRIERVTADGISTGDITIIRGFSDPAYYGAGHTYLVNPGDSYTVPCAVGLDLGGPSPAGGAR